MRRERRMARCSAPPRCGYCVKRNTGASKHRDLSTQRNADSSATRNSDAIGAAILSTHCNKPGHIVPLQEIPMLFFALGVLLALALEPLSGF